MTHPALKLENQLCFPLYAASKEVIKQYKPLLDAIGLTYTQYITMMVLWDEKCINVKSLGDRLYLDSGTLTPLLKKMETKGWLVRNRDLKDQRNVLITLTKEGEKLKEAAAHIPREISQCLPLTPQEAKQLYGLLYKVLGQVAPL